MRILIIHGPNLNLLGTREPHIYGSETLEEINDAITSYCEAKGIQATCFQSNHEGEIVDILQCGGVDGIVLNAAAYTHYSVAIRDAIAAIPTPVAEVHLSNVFAREAFRHTSLIAPVCLGSVSGFGSFGYLMAIDGLCRHLQK